MIDHKHKFIFVHIPKTAGQSIEIALDGYEQMSKLWGIEKDGTVLQHLTASDIMKRFNIKIFNNYFKFSFVRNPFSKCVSEYKWDRIVCKPMDFKSWVKFELSNLINNSRSKSIHERRRMHNTPQHDFIYDTDDQLLVDFVGKFENLQKDFDTACGKIGIPQQQLPHALKSKTKHYTEYYDDETREIVAELYAKDIELFEYKFGE